MYELIKISDMTYYINCPAKIGIYLQDGKNAYLIDSGNDKEAGKKVRKILDGQGWILKGILNTHSNADHIGGNRYLQTQTGCKVFSNGIEAAFTENTVLEPSFLYGGYPCKDLRHKFLMAQNSEVTDFSDNDFPSEIQTVPLYGHFFNMTGFLCPDGTFFIADCISSKSTLDKYVISFIYDVEEYLNTLDHIENSDAKFFVPSHADAAEDIKELVCYNREKVHEICNKILCLCKDGKIFEEILKQLFTEYGLSMNFEQYVLVGSTVKSYLAYLKDSGKLDIQFTDNSLIWKTL